MSLTEQQIKTALAVAVDPNTGKDFVAGKAVKNIKIDGADVAFDIELGYPAKTQIDAIRKQVIAAVRGIPGIGNVSANVHSKIVAHSVQMGVKLMRERPHGNEIRTAALRSDTLDLFFNNAAKYFE